MKIAVTSQGPTLDHPVETRFGRCSYFIVFDLTTMNFEAIENPNVSTGRGAGLQSAQLIVDKGVKYVLTGNCGPNAFQVFDELGVGVILNISGTIKEAIATFKGGNLKEASQPNVASHNGMQQTLSSTELKDKVSALEKALEEVTKNIEDVTQNTSTSKNIAHIDSAECTSCWACESTCPEGAILQSETGLPVVVENKCTGCGQCVEVCPQDAISLKAK